jgi:hypothetical protein
MLFLPACSSPFITEDLLGMDSPQQHFLYGTISFRLPQCVTACYQPGQATWRVGSKVYVCWSVLSGDNDIYMVDRCLLGVSVHVVFAKSDLRKWCAGRQRCCTYTVHTRWLDHSFDFADFCKAILSAQRRGVIFSAQHSRTQINCKCIKA